MLVRRGEIALYIEPALLMQDEEVRRINDRKVGRPFSYGNGLILAGFTLKCLLRFGYRQTEGVVRDICRKIEHFTIPNFRTIWYRITKLKQNEINFNIRPLKKGEKIEVAIDSSGIKKVNDGEYRTKMYHKRKGWIKLHLSVNVDTGEVLTNTITTDRISDNSQFKKLLEPIEKNISKLDGDGAYDTEANFDWLNERNITPGIPVMINSSTKCHGARRKQVREQLGLPKHRGTWKKGLGNRDRRKAMRDLWRKETKQGRRWRVEGTYSRYKGLYGEYVFSKKWDMVEKEIRAKLYGLNLIINQFS